MTILEFIREFTVEFNLMEKTLNERGGPTVENSRRNRRSQVVRFSPRTSGGHLSKGQYCLKNIEFFIEEIYDILMHNSYWKRFISYN